MKEEQQRFLSLLGQLPARLAAEQVAWVLNCQPHDVPILVAARLLKPLGNPPPNSVKFFAASELLELVEDRAWLAKVTNALNQHWQRRNAAKVSARIGNVLHQSHSLEKTASVVEREQIKMNKKAEPVKIQLPLDCVS